MKLIDIKNILRTVLFVHAAMAFTLAGTPGPAKNQVSCSVEGSDKADWVHIGKATDDFVCVKPGVKWGKYTRIQIEPSSVLTDEREPLKEEDMRKLTAFFDTKLQSSFQEQIASEGPVLRIKPTIVGIRRSKTAANAVGLVALKVPLSYGGADVRFDLIDDRTGETVGIVGSGGRGRAWNGFQGLSALGHSRVVLDRSAKQIRRDLDLLRKNTEAEQLSNASE